LIRYTDQEWELYEILMGLVPDFHKVILEFLEQPEQLEVFINLVSGRYMLIERHICTYMRIYVVLILSTAQRMGQWSTPWRHWEHQVCGSWIHTAKSRCREHQSTHHARSRQECPWIQSPCDRTTTVPIPGPCGVW
jgi:hypothetical protein